MFNKILFVTTGSPNCNNAGKTAFDLAKQHKSTLYILNVFGIPGYGESPFVVDIHTGEEKSSMNQEYVEGVKDGIKTIYADQLKEVGSAIIDCVAGVPHTEILRKARKEDVDLIIMGAHTHSEDIGATRYRKMLGSTMERVSKKAGCPVVIVSRPCTDCFQSSSNIVLGTDFSKAAYSAFLFAYKVAKTVGCKLYLFHTIDMKDIQVGYYTQEKIENEVENACKKIEEIYVPEMKGFDNYEIGACEGIPYVEILKFARGKSADLIVLSHHAREIDPEDALIGSTVEQVILRSSCPVASVNRPDKVAMVD
ncbi:MAG: universal stress protein [Thermodesulfobacteriota bacterium]|nr:universal stress protein [Thermodesulfobacteriota bacterium]